MFKYSLIATLILVPAIGVAADGAVGAKGGRAAQFRNADTDGNGTLSRAEFARAMPHLAPKFDSIDSNKDGELSRAELAAWKKAHRVERQAKAVERFRHADTDGDGAISRAEAAKHAPRLAKRFDQIDADKDGKLTPEELRAYREAKRSHREKV
ncbi:MAG: calcium sensor EFh [Betaproteobacteria bacterium]|nr:MAG: calcium sensor EFh [Betaproteobacteria bacterium]